MSMELLFEKSVPGRICSILPECDVPVVLPSADKARKQAMKLPELSENDISRHYPALERRSHGVNNGFYPLGSCTMKNTPSNVIASCCATFISFPSVFSHYII